MLVVVPLVGVEAAAGIILPIRECAIARGDARLGIREDAVLGAVVRGACTALLAIATAARAAFPIVPIAHVVALGVAGFYVLAELRLCGISCVARVGGVTLLDDAAGAELCVASGVAIAGYPLGVLALAPVAPGAELADNRAFVMVASLCFSGITCNAGGVGCDSLAACASLLTSAHASVAAAVNVARGVASGARAGCGPIAPSPVCASPGAFHEAWGCSSF